MEQLALKQKVATQALQHIENGMILGIGSGSTVACFIEALKNSGLQFKDIVAASEESAKHLRATGYSVSDLNACDPLDVYIDGADEVDPNKYLIKGGGAALTREKIIAANAKKFICIVDNSKEVKVLGQFPLPVEVIPMARSYVARELVKLGGEPRWREGIITDNGNWILDIHYLNITNPAEMEQQINAIAGVVTNGIFAKEHADIVLTSHKDGTINEW